ncbi:hypothetical protein CRUP_029861 [Coryphaenoides rupestris]|nr:hypothetical protein CRUP_029861 [Coryphaenoides rupestris]
MCTAGYERTVNQIINKLKKLKMDYRDQKRDIGRSGSGRPKRNPHFFDVLDSVLGERPACQITGAFNSATDTVEDTSPPSSTDAELPVHAGEEEPLACSSPTPSTSSTQLSSQQARHGKRKRDTNEDLLQYLERADERFLQHSKDMNDALLRKLDKDSSVLFGLMGRMVAVMEAQANK